MKRSIRNILLLVALALLAIARWADSARDEPAGTPAANPHSSLAGTIWQVEDISGAGVVDDSHTTLAFGGDHRVAGDSGCNRYFGDYEASGQSLKFGMLAGTLRACAEALMDQETRFQKAMGQVHSWRVNEHGLLELLDADGNVLIRAAPSME